jgi:phosphate transport system permease protein
MSTNDFIAMDAAAWPSTGRRKTRECDRTDAVAAAMAFGLFWLFWILFETIRLGVGGLNLDTSPR